MRRLVMAIVLLWGMAACCQEENEEVTPAYGTASALLNGQPWEIKPSGAGNSACYPTRLSMNFAYSNKEGLLRNSLEIGNFPKSIGTYNLLRFNPLENDCFSERITALFGTWQEDGDVVGEIYDVDEEARNELVITVYDSSAQRLEGTFQATMVARNMKDQMILDLQTPYKYKVYFQL